MSVDRREFLATVAAAQGAFVLGFWVPSRADAQTTSSTTAWYQEPSSREINAWVVIDPDDTMARLRDQEPPVTSLDIDDDGMAPTITNGAKSTTVMITSMIIPPK